MHQACLLYAGYILNQFDSYGLSDINIVKAHSQGNKYDYARCLNCKPDDIDSIDEYYLDLKQETRITFFDTEDEDEEHPLHSIRFRAIFRVRAVYKKNGKRILVLTLSSAYPRRQDKEITRAIWDMGLRRTKQTILTNWKNTIDIFKPSFLVTILKRIYSKRMSERNINKKIRSDLNLIWPVRSIYNFDEIFCYFKNIL